jgi:hypothetical protein
MEKNMNITTKNDGPSDPELKGLAENLIIGQSTMTLATAQNNIAWAAPVYYASVEFKLYFFSDPTSRHIKECMESGQTSAAIFLPASTWQEIRGVQMSGSIRSVSIGLESVRALRVYLKKYPFTKNFFDSNQHMDLDTFVKKFRVKLYRFQPSLIYYQDNQIRFGFREKVPL